MERRTRLNIMAVFSLASCFAVKASFLNILLKNSSTEYLKLLMKGRIILTLDHSENTIQ